MNALILGGQSPRHQVWVRQVAESLQPYFQVVTFLDYRHWQDDSEPDVAYEMEQASKLAATLGEYVIVAKSLGTVITTRAVEKQMLNPAQCVFLGFPLEVVNKTYQDIAAKLASLPATTVVQNTYDPTGSFELVEAYVKMHGNRRVNCLETPGDTHNYIDFALIAKLASGTH